MDKLVLEQIRSYVERLCDVSNSYEKTRSKVGDYRLDKGSADYLLNQLLRELKLPETHYHVSDKLKKMWTEDMQLDIKDLLCHRHTNLIQFNPKDLDNLPDCLKQHSTPYKRQQNDCSHKVIFNDCFHDEHIVTIHDIIYLDDCGFVPLRKKQKDPLSDAQIETIVGKIHICSMLKTENAAIEEYNKSISTHKGAKSTRPLGNLDWQATANEYYKVINPQTKQVEQVNIIDV